jgi:hypothetical protein
MPAVDAIRAENRDGHASSLEAAERGLDFRIGVHPDGSHVRPVASPWRLSGVTLSAGATNPFDHYNIVGWTEGRDPSLGFDTTAYLSANSNVKAAAINRLLHFLEFGLHEGRAAQADGLWG